MKKEKTLAGSFFYTVLLIGEWQDTELPITFTGLHKL
jgi:hypothetical protein